METLPTGGRFTWSAAVLGVTTGNCYFGPEIVIPEATARPLIGRGEPRVEWNDASFLVNRDPVLLSSHAVFLAASFDLL